MKKEKFTKEEIEEEVRKSKELIKKGDKIIKEAKELFY